MSGSESPSEDGMTRSSMECEAGAIKLSQVRLIQVENKLEGYFTFDASFGALEQVDYFIEFERVDSP